MTIDKPVLLTEEGLEKLQAELRQLIEVRRPDISERIREAKEFGDISENAEYQEAKNEQGMIEGRILDLEQMIRNAELIDAEAHHTVVEVGSTVKLKDSEGEFTYKVVGSAEADPTQGRISLESPVGRALMGRKAGEEVTVKVPDGESKVKILKVD
ncbi:MAG: transcription elongation factor GreA [Candidatus Dormibacteria bacterium]